MALSSVYMHEFKFLPRLLQSLHDRSPGFCSNFPTVYSAYSNPDNPFKRKSDHVIPCPVSSKAFQLHLKYNPKFWWPIRPSMIWLSSIFQPSFSTTLPLGLSVLAIKVFLLLSVTPTSTLHPIFILKGLLPQIFVWLGTITSFICLFKCQHI